MTLIYLWHTFQIDYVLGFPQAPIEFDMYMEIPKGVELAHAYGSNRKHVLKLLKNLSSIMTVLRERLIKIGYLKSKMDECMFFKQDINHIHDLC